MPLTKSHTASRQAISALYHFGVNEKYMEGTCIVRFPVAVSVAACHQMQPAKSSSFLSFNFPPIVAQ